MKRMTTIVLLTICVLAIGSWSYAQHRGKGCGRGCGNSVSASNTGCGMNYVDSDGDGVCDNAGLRNGKGRGHGRRFHAKNGTGTASQHGPRYVDENNDGVCDNIEANQNQPE